MNPTLVLTLLFQSAAKYVPFPLNLFLPVLLDLVLGLVKKDGMEGYTAPPGVAAAPDQLKDWLTKVLTEFVYKIQRPVLRRVLQSVIDNLSGELLDALWDRLFERGLVGTRPPRTAPRELRNTDAVFGLDRECEEDLKTFTV